MVLGTEDNSIIKTSLQTSIPVSLHNLPCTNFIQLFHMKFEKCAAQIKFFT